MSITSVALPSTASTRVLAQAATPDGGDVTLPGSVDPTVQPMPNIPKKGEDFAMVLRRAGLNTMDVGAVYGLSIAPATVGYALYDHLRSPNLTMANAIAPRAGQQLLRITPIIASAYVGAGIADGASYVIPNIIPKYRNDMNVQQKTYTRMSRGVIAGAFVGLAAGVVWLKWPSLIKPGIMRDALWLSPGATDAARAGIDLAKANAPLVNRATIGIVGGIATAALGAKYASSTDPDARKAWGTATAVAGGLTLAGTVFGGKLTRGAEGAWGAAFLPGEGFLKFPHIDLKQFVKDYATKVIPYTVAPAATAAYESQDVYDAHGKITDPRSQFNNQWNKPATTTTTTPAPTPRPTLPPASTPPRT